MKLANFIKSALNYIHYFRFGGVSFARKSGVIIGDHCRIYTRNFGTEPFLISIGNNVTLTPGVHFITHDGSGSLTIDKKGRRYYYAPISIGNNVMIGLNSIIMPGVKIEDNVIVAAGSVITKSVPTNSIVAGIPAKIIGDFNSFKVHSLNNWKSELDLDLNLSYEERIKKIADKNFKPYL